MIEPKIGNILIKNFRSLRGTVSIPFDAPIILLHGSNGMGKTSILSALELALTGQIEHLSRVDANYGSHLLCNGTEKGSIIVTNEKRTALMPATGEIVLSKSGFSGKSLLDTETAKFFSERCYLPQSLLSRLLEIYQDSSASDRTTQLTRFVNDLLGLDQLDALIEGLHVSLNVTRIRNLIPEFRRFENTKSEVEDVLGQLRTNARRASEEVNRSLKSCTSLVRELYPTTDPARALAEEPTALLKYVRSHDNAARSIDRLTAARQELQGLWTRWQRLPQTLSSRERAARERAEAKARDDYAAWRNNTGARLDAIRQNLIETFPTLPSPIRGRKRFERRL
jgi:exonuclease SbcC